MNITFEEREARFSKTADEKLFIAIANTTSDKFNVIWIRLDGFDQRYWDFKLDNCELTLHLEHYLGISLFPTSKTDNVELEDEAIKRIADYLVDMHFEEVA